MAKKHTKKALFTSVMSLVLCFAMLVGTTFAWFTDSVTSGNNIIKSGNLDVAMYWADGTKAVPDDYSTDWIDASTGAMFNYKLWEPGYTDVRHIKIENKGSLALKYQLMIQANGTVSELSDVIDVYYADPATQVADRSALKNSESMATLTKALSGMNTSASGNLEAGESRTVTLALKMRDEAGNEYQQMEIGTDFSVVLVATQLENESDSFGPEYDKGAAWDGTIPDTMPESLVVDTEKKLISINDAAAFAYLNTLLNDGNFVANYGEKWKYSVELNCDINLFNKEWTPIILSNVVAFEGNGHTIRNLKITSGNDSVGLFGAVATNDLGYGAIKNLTIDGAYVKGGNNSGVLVGVSHGTIENVTVLNATIEANKYIGGLAGRTCHVKNCAIKNSTVVASDKTVGGLVGYCIVDPGQATATGNTVENVRVTGTWNVGGMFGQAQNATVDGNTVKNVTVTSTTELPADADANEVRADKVAARSRFETTTIGTNTVENVTLINVVNKPVEIAPAPLEEDFLFPAGTNAVLYKDMILTGDAQIVHEESSVLGLQNVTATLDHDVIIRKSSGAICISDSNFTLTDGAKLITVGEGGDAYQVFLVNVIVNGELLTQENAGQYLEGINNFNAVPEWPNT